MISPFLIFSIRRISFLIFSMLKSSTLISTQLEITSLNTESIDLFLSLSLSHSFFFSTAFSTLASLSSPSIFSTSNQSSNSFVASTAVVSDSLSLVSLFIVSIAVCAVFLSSPVLTVSTCVLFLVSTRMSGVSQLFIVLTVLLTLRGSFEPSVSLLFGSLDLLFSTLLLLSPPVVIFFSTNCLPTFLSTSLPLSILSMCSFIPFTSALHLLLSCAISLNLSAQNRIPSPRPSPVSPTFS